VPSRLVISLVCGFLLATGASLPARPVTAAAAAAAATAPAAQPGDPLPECRYADVKTRYRSTDDWRKTLVDTERRVGSGYVPPGLVSVSQAGIGGSGRVRSALIDDLAAMANAAGDAGAGIAVRSAYRSYAQQKAVFRSWVNKYGYAEALRTSARPGHSEHQLGTTIDFRSADSARAPWDYDDWATTAPGAWMKANAWQYGFAMSYPRGKSGVSCYAYEPWHYRYYGRSIAAKIHASGTVPRRYLWKHFETAP
jgi:D-alanyl-D-alanine carboxypeptidase